MFDWMGILVSLLGALVALIAGASLVILAARVIGADRGGPAGVSTRGQWARVAVPIPSQGVGSVRVAGGGATARPARAQGGLAIKSGEPVVVIDVTDGVLEVVGDAEVVGPPH